MGKLNTLVIFSALPLAAASYQAYAQRSAPLPAATAVASPLKPLVTEAPDSRFNPRLEFNSSRIKEGFELGEATIEASNGAKFVDLYANELEAKLKAQSVGYAFVVRYRDSSIVAARSGGDARRAPDINPRALTVDDRLNIANISQTLTAVTLLKLIAKRNLSLDVKAYTLLPPNWNFGPNFKTVSVRELLTHHSGLRFAGEGTLQNLQTGVAAGIKLADKPVYGYNNSNFALMRVMIARLIIPNFKP